MNTPRIPLWARIFGVVVTCHPLQAQQNLGFTYGGSEIASDARFYRLQMTQP